MLATGDVGPSSAAPPPLILIVEDDVETRQFYTYVLRGEGFRTDQAHNGLQAFEKAVHDVPDLILTDIAVPGIDGIELCRRLRADERTRGIPGGSQSRLSQWQQIARAAQAQSCNEPEAVQHGHARRGGPSSAGARSPRRDRAANPIGATGHSDPGARITMERRASLGKPLQRAFSRAPCSR